MPIVKKTPYHIQAYELIKDMILSGEMVCGEKLNEIKLSQELQISRSPIREALRILEQDGLIIAAPSGRIVNPLDMNTILEVYECRIGIESYAARLACRNFTELDYDKLVKSVKDCRKADEEQDNLAIIDLNNYFHNHIVSLSKNSYIISEVERISNIVNLSRLKELQEVTSSLSYAYDDHLEIANKLLEHEEDAVERLMRKHIANNITSLLKMQQK